MPRADTCLLAHNLVRVNMYCSTQGSHCLPEVCQKALGYVMKGPIYFQWDPICNKCAEIIANPRQPEVKWGTRECTHLVAKEV